MIDVDKEIDYWCETAQNDLHCFPDDKALEEVKNLFKLLYAQGQLKWYFDKDKKGIMVYGITPDFRGGLSVNELFMYIKPEYRGSIRLFKELVNHLEEVAKENNCGSVRIASNIGYDDQKVLRVLKLFGYETDVVVKYMR
jgi:hypothetical protein